MNWYYTLQGRQVGPVDQNAFDQLVASGEIQPATLVWNGEMPNWKPLSETGPASGPTSYCSECGAQFPNDEMIQFGATRVCANCKDVFAHKLREGVSLGQSRRYGGFWLRGLALLIDSVISWIFFFVISAALFQNLDPLGRGRPAAFVAVQLLIGVAYVVWFIHQYGGTLGKLALGLRVTTAQGDRLSLGQSAGRYLAFWLSNLTLGIGFIIAAFDPQKRSLHDRICNTRVVKI